MSSHQTPNTRHFRASSSQQGTSSITKFSPNDKLYDENLGYIKRYLSKYDNCPEKNEFLSKLEENRSFSAQKNVNDSSYTDLDQKHKESDNFGSQADMARRINSLEYKVNDLTQKLVSRGSDKQQEDNVKINERFVSIERRVDMMDRRLEKLTATLETFMHKFQGQIAPQEGYRTVPEELRTPIEHSQIRREVIHETEERLPEIKLLDNNFTREPVVETSNVLEQKPYIAHRRAQSKDTFDVRDRVRESLDQVGRKKDEIVLQAKQSSYRERVDRVEPKILAVEQPERNRLFLKSQEKQIERLETRESDVMKSQSKIKGSLRSPDTARKRKNVSWSENCVSEGNEGESEHNKRKRMDISDNREYERYNENKYEKKWEDSDIARRAREILEETSASKYKGASDGKAQRGSSVTREEDNYEKQMRYITGDVRTEKIKSEVEKLEEKLRKIEAGGKDGQNVTEKERQLEEKRRKIDEEIQRRINKVDTKKRGDVGEGKQRRMSQFENDVKSSSYDQEGLVDKEIMSRNELLAKYSDLINNSGKKSKNI